ncbi:MAG: biotin--acetyl-CoA-carboxylase ligase [Gammaproteobacteria bacterium]|nr:MAG: biotin--acetyl-CoA-carboxylase ligase [Gammaproteobacteria bacterium]RLA54147.1 MAG: biotin--acetyl-CoA-carboxylase ligase [Gammaproteobacteria bacterium]
MRFFLLLFILVPVVEMWLLIKVGTAIGALPTIGLVLLTAVVGLALLRRQGFATLMRGRYKMESGEIPAMEMIEGLVLAVSGAMLLTPGFFTDTIGFLGLLPATRHWLVKRLMARASMVEGYYQTSSTQAHTIHAETQHKETLEGEYRRED